MEDQLFFTLSQVCKPFQTTGLFLYPLTKSIRKTKVFRYYQEV